MGTMCTEDFVILILVSIGIFLITRELWCWYWKINTIIERLDEISIKLNNNWGINTIIKKLDEISKKLDNK